MTSGSDSRADESVSSAPPLIDRPVEGLLEWDSPFRQTFVVGSDWAPWLASAGFPPHDWKPRMLPPPTVRPPQPPEPAAADERYVRYRREYESRLDDAYAEWKRTIVGSLLEPWLTDRRAAARRLGNTAQDRQASEPGQALEPGQAPPG